MATPTAAAASAGASFTPSPTMATPALLGQLTQRLDLAVGHQRRARLVDAHLRGDRLGHAQVVAREHHHPRMPSARRLSSVCLRLRARLSATPSTPRKRPPRGPPWWSARPSPAPSSRRRSPRAAPPPRTAPRLPTATSSVADPRAEALAVDGLAAVGLLEGDAPLGGAVHDGPGQRVLGQRLDGRRRCTAAPRRWRRPPGVTVISRGLPTVRVPVLSKAMRRDLAQRLQVGAALDQHAAAGRRGPRRTARPPAWRWPARRARPPPAATARAGPPP